MDRLVGSAVCAAVTVMVASACSGNAGSGESITADTEVRADVATARCPVTRANGLTPPGVAPSSQGPPVSHGNGELWTAFPTPRAVVERGVGQVMPDGSIAVKFPWWARVESPVATDRPMGLRITGRRLHRRAPALRARIPTGYGPGFQATTIIFPKRGCWPVTGSTRRASLTFVVMVRGR